MANVALEIQPTLEAEFTFAQEQPFVLERGGQLQPVTLRYAVYGELARNRDRVVLACHALSGSARVADWWTSFFGAGLPFDTERCCVIGVNLIGSCYGSTGPTSTNPKTGTKYGPDFPVVTLVDNVRAQAILLDHLGIDRLLAVIGGSIGGMQALEWGLRFPQRVRHAIAMCAAPLNAMGLALNHLQRQAIWNDPDWKGGDYQTEPAALRTGIEMLWLMGSNPALRQQEAPTLAQADQVLDRYVESNLKTTDANDLMYALAASRDYDPGPGLEKIEAPLLAVNSADDLINPPELGILEREIKRVPHGRAIVIPYSAQTHGHGSHTYAVLWKSYLEELLKSPAR